MSDDSLNFDWLNLDIPLTIDDMPNNFAERNQLQDKANQANIDSLKVLKEIKMNTDYLRGIVDLLNVNNTHQKELNEMVQSILNIAKSTDKEEANTRYRSVMKKIGDFAAVTSSTVNVVKLSSLAAMVLKCFLQSH